MLMSPKKILKPILAPQVQPVGRGYRANAIMTTATQLTTHFLLGNLLLEIRGEAWVITRKRVPGMNVILRVLLVV